MVRVNRYKARLVAKDINNKKVLIIMTHLLLLQNLSQFVLSSQLLLLKIGHIINWMSITLSFTVIFLKKYICAFLLAFKQRVTLVSAA